MANWIDAFSFIVTVTVLGAFVYGVLFVIQQVRDSLQDTKARLKTKGLDISTTGVSIKTQKRFDREHYVDATQRGFVKAVGASSFGKADNTSSSDASPSGVSKQLSSSSSKSNGGNDQEEKKKRGLFHRNIGSSKEKQ